MKIIEKNDMKKYFKYISISLMKKKEMFTKIFNEGIAILSKSLVIGDNVYDEIKAAKELGVDTVSIGDFLKEISVAKKD
ncbi:hypothetical protein M0R04_02360 [Candidatus Dojkabacteria bacterium]|nr:hypothetical protein [Candidatus Dojkabacteria bacterium]